MHEDIESDIDVGMISVSDSGSVGVVNSDSGKLHPASRRRTNDTMNVVDLTIVDPPNKPRYLTQNNKLESINKYFSFISQLCIIARSPDKAAAIPNSCCDQST